MCSMRRLIAALLPWVKWRNPLSNITSVVREHFYEWCTRNSANISLTVCARVCSSKPQYRITLGVHSFVFFSSRDHAFPGLEA